MRKTHKRMRQINSFHKKLDSFQPILGHEYGINYILSIVGFTRRELATAARTKSGRKAKNTKCSVVFVTTWGDSVSLLQEMGVSSLIRLKDLGQFMFDRKERIRFEIK